MCKQCSSEHTQSKKFANHVIFEKNCDTDEIKTSKEDKPDDSSKPNRNGNCDATENNGQVSGQKCLMGLQSRASTDVSSDFTEESVSVRRSDGDQHTASGPKHVDTWLGTIRGMQEPKFFPAIVMESSVSSKAGIVGQIGHVIVTSAHIIFASSQSCLCFDFTLVKKFHRVVGKDDLLKIEFGSEFEHGEGMLEFSTTPAYVVALYERCIETAARIERMYTKAIHGKK